jgi:hypothetical protein
MFTIAWLLLNLTLSFPLCLIIVKFISNKSVLSVSLVDLIYRDAIVYLYLLCCTATTGFILCLLKEESLSFTMSATYSGCAMFFADGLFISLIFSGSLRMISLLRNSEVNGLQLLGPENIAIIKIRFISISISFAFQIVMIFYFGAHSGLFHTFYESETNSHLEEVTANNFKALYFIWPISTVIIHSLTKLISHNLKKKLNQSVEIFIIQQQPVKTNGSYTFSYYYVMGFPLAIACVFFSSSASRKYWLLFFYLVQVTIISVILPLGIINQNKKLKTYFEQTLIDPIKDKLVYMYLSFKKLNLSKVSP